MKKLKVIRFEGIYAICEDHDNKLFAIQTSELPAGTAAGKTLVIDEIEGTVSLFGEGSL